MDVLALSDKSRLVQLQQETICWQNDLSWMSQQNDEHKKKLSDLLNSIFSPNLIGQAEEFQDRFLITDRSIGRLRIVLAKIDNLLLKAILEDGTVDSDILNIFESLRLKMKEEEQDLNKLKTSFCNYLEGIA